MVNRRDFVAGATAAGLGSGLMSSASAAATPTYRVWEVGDRNGIGALRPSQRAGLAAAPGHAVIEVHYSAINARDLGIVGGPFPPGIAPQRVPLADGAGRVIATGDGVDDISVGDRVIANHFVNWVDGDWDPVHYTNDVSTSLDGWLGEYVALPAKSLVKIPESVNYRSACTLTGAGVTAWHALFEVARVQPGETVLSLGTGGVSTFGLLLAKLGGARVVVTSSSDDKLAKMLELGADVGINYVKNPAWGAEVIARTQGRGANVVLENVGRKTLDQSMRATAVNARIVMIGTGPMPEKLPSLPGIYQKNLLIKAISNGSNRMLRDLMNAAASNAIDPVIGAEYSFEQAPEALAFMARSSHIGKVVIRHR